MEKELHNGAVKSVRNTDAASVFGILGIHLKSPIAMQPEAGLWSLAPPPKGKKYVYDPEFTKEEVAESGIEVDAFLMLVDEDDDRYVPFIPEA